MATGSTRTTQANLLRTVYQKNMRRQFSQKSILLQAFARNTRNYSPGKEISIPLHAASGEGPTWNSAGNLPAASFEQVERATFSYKWLLDRIQILGDFEDDAGSAEAAEMSPYEFQTKALVKRGRHDLNFDLFGAGDGLISDITSASSATVLIADDIRGLRNNLRVDIILKANGAPGAGGVKNAKITLNRATKTVTLTEGTMADGDGSDVNANPTLYAIYRAGAYNDALFGLDAAVSASNPASANYGNIDRSLDANDFYRSISQLNGGVARAPSMKLMQDVIDEIDKYSEGVTDLIVCGHSVWNALAERMDSDRRYKGETTTLNGWATALRFASVNAPIVRDKHCPEGKMYFLDRSTFTIFQNNEGAWMAEDGAILHRVSGKVAYEAAWHRRLQLICWSPISNGVLGDLAYVGAVT